MMTIRGLKLLAAAAALSMASGLAMAAEPLRLAVTDLEGLENLQREFGAFKEVLEKTTGYPFKFYPVASRTAAAEALRSEKVEFVLTGPAEYVVIRKKTEARAIVGFGRPDYFSGIVVLADSGINTVADLKGKKVAFGDVGSTSNHLAPMQVLADYGIDPRASLQAMHVHRNVAWEGLKRGDVAAAGMNYGYILKFRAGEKSLEPGAFKVIARGPDLPNDVLMAGKHVDAKVVETVRKAFVDHSKDLVAAILTGEDNQKYKGMKFLPDVKDSDYDYVRSMYRTIGFPQFADFVGN